MSPNIEPGTEPGTRPGVESRIEPSIRSRPVYGVLSVTEAPAHLLVADAEGGAALLDLAAAMTPAALMRSEILYVPGASTADRAADHADALRALDCPVFHVSPSIDALLPRLARSIERMKMGTCLQFSGSETLIGRAMQVAMQAGIDYQAIQTEHRGSLARRMQCVHCKGITENVTTQPANCAHCGLLLLVRDHYSRRYAAFQGVNINAEDPSDVPAKEELFP